jgi:hypothetical protein
MRGAGLDQEAVTQIAAVPMTTTTDKDGNPIAVGLDRRGRQIKVVIALDDPECHYCHR